MSEKEVIETLINYNLSNHFNNTKFFEALNCLLLMYNQEKEKNKDIANDLEKYKRECYLLGRKDENKSMLGVIKRHYISKDKIRALINENVYPDTYNFKTISAKRLEKLLEE